MNLDKILYGCTSLLEFDQHIQQVVLPLIKSKVRPEPFLKYIREIVVPSKKIADKKFFLLMFYSTSKSYQKLLDEEKKKLKLDAFKLLLTEKIDNAIQGLSENGQKHQMTKDNNNKKLHRIKSTMTYLLDSLRSDYILL